MSPRNGDPRKRYGFTGKEGRVVAIVDEGEAEGDREEVEIGVVSGEGDEAHQGKETERSGEAGFGLGKEDCEGKQEFDHEGENGGEFQKRVRELVNEPGEGIGNGLGLEVVGHGGEIGPCGVTAEDFDDAGAEHESGEEEPQSPLDEAGRSIGPCGAGEESGFF